MYSPFTHPRTFHFPNRRVTVIKTALTIVITVGSGLIFWFAAAGAQADTNPPSNAHMTVRFVPSEFATHYATTINSGLLIEYQWKLQVPSVDPACNNAGLVSATTSEFVWHHPDAINSNPAGLYNCNHNVEGPEGHLGTVSVTVTGSTPESQGNFTPVWQCKASYLGTNAPNGQPTWQVPMDCVPISGGVIPPVVASSSGSSGLLIALIVVALVAIGGVVFWKSRRSVVDDCAELAKRCEELRAQAAAARAAAERAATAASAAKANLDRAKSEVQKAQHEVDVVDGPDQSSSWVEDPETGRRITEYDLALQRADESSSGQVNDYTPQYQAQLRKKASDRAHAALDAAHSAATAAQDAYDKAQSDSVAAAKLAQDLNLQADAACKLAAECAKTAADAAAAAAAAAAAVTPPAPAGPPPTVSPPTPPVAPPTPPPVTPPPTVSPPTNPPPTRAATAPQCEEGEVRVGEPHGFDVDMFPLALVNLQVSGYYQMSDHDVENAMRGFENFKAVVDIAEFVEGFASSGGDLASGAVSLDTSLNVFSSGVGQLTDTFDPGATLEDSTITLLKEVIKRVNLTRGAGDYSMSCPLVRVHVSCTPSEVCGGGYWMTGPSKFELTYGSVVRIGHYPKQIEVLAFGRDVPALAAAAIQTLRHYFERQNEAPMKKIRDAARACARGH